ncbi:MAG: shikimate kinase [Kofleriaceae bacterium]
MVASSPDYLASVGAAVRSQRERRGWSRRELASQSGVSERFLAQLELGDGNISLRRFAEVAHALGTTPTALLAAADAPQGSQPIALLGVRGAGKSAVGSALAKKLSVAFIELDQEIEQAAGLPLGELFALHGEAYYRRIEREVLTRVLATPAPMVLATGGSIVNDPTNYSLLRSRCRTIWLRARPEDHWNRVVAQGDQRPMAENPHAFAELRALLTAREKLYGRADLSIETTGRRVPQVVSDIVSELGAAGASAVPALTPAAIRGRGREPRS